MRKHFLLLMLMALLPLAGWAEDYTITVTPYVVSKTYGSADPGTDTPFPEAKFKLVSFSAGCPANDEAKVSAAEILKMVRIESGEVVGAYAYTFQEEVTVASGTYAGNYTIVCTQNGSLNITPKAFTITATAAEKTYDGTAAPTADLDYTLKVGGVAKNWNEILATSDLKNGAPKAGLFSIARATDGVNAATYDDDIVPVWTDNDNYEVTIVPANYTINPKPLVGVNFKQAAYEITFGETPSFEFELQDEDESLVGEETLADNFGAVLAGGGDLPTAVTAATNIKVVCTSGNYALTNDSEAATFAVLAKNATSTDLTFTIANDLAYIGNNIAMTYGEDKIVDVMDKTTRLAEGTSYTVKYYPTEADATAGTNECAAIKNATTYYAKFTLAGNYTGTKIVSFAVVPVELTVTAENKVKGYGVDDPVFTVSYTGWVGDDATAAATNLETFLASLGDAFTAPTVTRADKEAETGENVGDHALTVSGAVVPNYTLKYVAGKLTIGKAVIEIACENKEKTWKSEDPEFTYIVVPAALKAELTGLPVLTRAEGEDLGTFAITATGATADENKYTITYVPGTLTINKATLTITAKDQTVAQGDAAINTEVSDATVTVTGFVNGESIADLAAAGTEFTAPLVISKAGAADLDAADEYANGVELSGLASVHYDIDYNFGTLNVIGAGMDLTLTRDEYCLDKINAAKGKLVNVKFDSRALQNEKWNSFILPFDVTVAKLSKAFGYAIVNTLNTATSTGSEVHFKLEMGTIPANTPFLMKINGTDENIDNTNDVTIPSVTIVNPEGDAGVEESYTVGTEGNSQFVGIYVKTPIENSLWQFPNNAADGAAWVGGNTGVNLKPLAAYVIKGEANARIFVEDLENNTTVIKELNTKTMETINAEGMYNLNGMKLNSVPTQKGVYIINGKKVVIK